MTTTALRALVLAVATAAVASLAACSSDDAAVTDGDESATPHGYVEGAEETADTQYRLVVGSAAEATLAVIDLATGDTEKVGTAPGITGLLGDGRYGYAHTADGTTHVVDSGGWTVDHGDHVHYYRTEPRVIGTLDAAGELVAVHASSTRTVLTYADSTVVMDRSAQDDGKVTVLERLPRQADAAVLPLDGAMLVPTEQNISVRVKGTAGVQVPCVRPGTQTITRRGALYSCADGAVLITERGAATRIPHPSGTSGSATAFAHRSGSAGVFASGPSGSALLDVSARRWTPMAPGTPERSTATGETGPIVSVGAGVVQVRRTPQTPPVITELPNTIEAGTVEADTSRAYVNDPRSNRIFEIDYRDNARLARTITTPGAASFFVETGR